MTKSIALDASKLLGNNRGGKTMAGVKPAIKPVAPETETQTKN